MADSGRVAGWTLGAIGGVLFLASAANLFAVQIGQLREVRPVLLLAEPLDLGLAAGVVYLGYRLTQSPLSAVKRWQVVLWAISGLIVAEVVTGLFFGHLLVKGVDIPVTDVVQAHLLAGGAGLISAFFAGAFNATAQQRTDELAAQRDGFAFLNSVLRHNVLNSVNIIKGYADILSEEAADRNQEQIAVIEARSDSIADLVREARTIAAVFAEKTEPSPVNLSTLLGEEVELARTSFDGAQFQVWVPENLYVRGVASLSAVFDNLLSNAVEHNDADTPRVNVTVREEGDYVSVRVMDNGPGVPDDRKDEIFQPKDRGDDGLGLYLVKTLVEDLGGAVDVSDNDPRGTVFTVYLPRADPPGERVA